MLKLPVLSSMVPVKVVTCGDHAAVKFTHRDLGTLNIRPLLDFSAEGDGR